MKFYANPYNTSVNGFFFETLDEFQEKVSALKDSFGLPVEEFEIDPIDGTQEELELASAAQVDQGNLAEFIEFIDGPEDQWPTVFYLMNNNGMSLIDALESVEECDVVESSLENYAVELVDDCYFGEFDKDTKQFLESYFDYAKFANDLRICGDCVEFEFGGNTYTCINANQ